MLAAPGPVALLLLAAQHLLGSVHFHPVGYSLPVGDKPPVKEAEPGGRIPGRMVMSDIQLWEVGMGRMGMIPQKPAAALF